jgi:dTMP kinase
MTYYPGKLVVFEGIDQAGKTSVIKELPELLVYVGCKVPIVICGEKESPIAPLLSGEALKVTSAFIKTYLFAADRAWTYEKICLPALKCGKLVLWDRYVDSALVYRAVDFSLHKSEIDLDFVKLINQPFINPNLKFYIDICVKTSLIRATQDTLTEPYDLEFLKQVRMKYLALASKQNYIIINGERPISKVARNIVFEIKKRIKEIF